MYRPAQAPPSGVAILAHGFARSRVRHRDLARALAEAGVIAVVPDLPNVVDLWGNGRALADFVTSLEEGAVPSLPVARDRIVLIGTSAGGLATLLAAARLPGIAGWIGLDPVDRTGTGMRAASQLASPAVVMLAEPSLCNLIESGRAIAEALPQRLRTVDVDRRVALRLRGSHQQHVPGRVWPLDGGNADLRDPHRNRHHGATSSSRRAQP